MTSAGKGTPVGALYYEVTLDTKAMIEQQRAVDRELKRTTDSLDKFDAKLSAITSAIKAFAAASYLIAQSDAYTKLNAQLGLATDNSQQFAKAQGDVKRIATEAQTSISGVGTLYARISTATKELGVSQSQVADITRTVALALKVSGAGAQESASATLQLSQAFAAGALRGEEFNSVSEAAPRLMRALADGIGVPVGQLRSLAEQGKLTSDVLANALPKALKDLEVEAQSIQTIGGAFENLKTELLLFIGEQTSASGAAKLVAESITTVAANLDLLTSAALGFVAAKLASTMLDISIQSAQATKTLVDQVAAMQASRAAAIAAAQANVQKIQGEIASLAAAKAGILVAREQYVAELELINAFRARGLAMGQASAVTTELAVLGRQQAAVTAQQTAATVALTAAQRALTTAQGASGAAAGLASRALGLLGGPIGLVTTVLGLGVTAWSLWGSSSKENEKQATDHVERSTEEIVADLDKQIERIRKRNELAAAGLGDIAKQDSEDAKKMATLHGQINNLMAGKGLDGGAPLPEAARVELLQVLLRQYGTLAGRIQTLNAEQEKLAAAGTASKLSQWMLKYATDAEKAAEEIKKAKKDLNGAIPPELEQRIKQKYEPPKKPPKDRFDEIGYLAGLQKQIADPYEKINVAEQESLRKNAELLKQGNITRGQAAEAALLIEQNAMRDRLELNRSGLDELKKDIKTSHKDVVEEEKKHAEERARAVQYAAQLTQAVNPIDALRQEYEAKLEIVTLYEQMMAQAGVDATAQGEQTRTEITRQYQQQRLALAEQSFRSQGDANAFLIDSLNALSTSATSSIVGLINGTTTAQEAMRGLANVVLNEAVSSLVQIGIQQVKNALLSDTLAAADKARAVANGAVYAASVSAQVAGMTAMAAQNAFAATAAIPIVGPGLAPAAAAAAAAASTAIGAPAVATAPLAGARQYGGPVDAGGLYRVGESNKPEMFVADSGRSYMIPGERGKVVSNGDLARQDGRGIKIVIENHGTPQRVVSQSFDAATQAHKLVMADLEEQFGTNTGRIYNTLTRTTNVRGRL